MHSFNLLIRIEQLRRERFGFFFPFGFGERGDQDSIWLRELLPFSVHVWKETAPLLSLSVVMSLWVGWGGCYSSAQEVLWHFCLLNECLCNTWEFVSTRPSLIPPAHSALAHLVSCLLTLALPPLSLSFFLSLCVQSLSGLNQEGCATTLPHASAFRPVQVSLAVIVHQQSQQEASVGSTSLF